MTQITSLVIMIFANTLAFWQKDMVIYLASGVITLIFGLTWIDSYEGISVVLCGLGTYQVLKGLLMALVSESPSRGISQFKGLWHKARGR